ncbi:MAG: sigma-54-dependent transcriptional regulator [Cellvibrionaceae bacterium]
MSLAVQAVGNELNTQVVPHVLIVEDDPSLREALQDTLDLADYHTLTAPDVETALVLLEKHNDIAMIVSDVNMGALSGHDLLHQVQLDYAHIPVLLITAYASIQDSVDAIRHGAIDYLVKPFEPKALIDIVAKQLDGREDAMADEPIAKSPSSQQLLQLANRMAQTDSTVLIIGESGTGKEVLARYIHQRSPRVQQPFIAINCAAIPENMLEAMLFGYEKGAYTGAYASAPGKFEQANGGTLLLDEISEMDVGLQAKLLRVLQEQEVERLGGRKTIQLNVRVIATSNRNMQQQVADGKFREDLYYRLSVLPLQWKPLRERREDILPLAMRLLQKHAIKQKRIGIQLDESAQRSLYDYAWPGNVRELDNVIQRALILQAGESIGEQDLGLQILTTQAISMDAENSAVSCLAESSFSRLNQLDGSREALIQAPNSQGSGLQGSHYGMSLQDRDALTGHGPSSSVTENNAFDLTGDRGKALGDDLKRREFEIIVETLKEENGSRKNTAERLGISPRTLRYKLAKMREIGLSLENQASLS